MVDTLNLLFVFFLLLLFSVFINTNTALHLLFTAELIWIVLYGITLVVGLLYDNLNILSLTFFFLVLSAIEFAVGLVILLIQNLFCRTLSLNDNDTNAPKFLNRFKLNLYVNKLFFK